MRIVIKQTGPIFDDLVKQPADAFDLVFDYSRLLAGDTIDTSVWSLPEGWTAPAVDTIHPDLDAVIAWLGGGTPGTTGVISNIVTTVGGRIHSAWMTVRVGPEAPV